MDRIASPLKPPMTGAAVKNLHDGIQAMIEHGVISHETGIAGVQLILTLAQERGQQQYGNATRTMVRRFQEARHLSTTGIVDEPTADAMNRLLREWGVVTDPIVRTSYVVRGKVRNDAGAPVVAKRVRALRETPAGMLTLGDSTTDPEGRYSVGFDLLANETVDLRVALLGDGDTRVRTSDLIRAARPVEDVDLTVPATTPAAEQSIAGRIMMQHGAPAAAMKLRLYATQFGGAQTLLREDTTSDDGQYTLPYDLAGKAARLEVKAVDAAGKEIPLSRPIDATAEGIPQRLNLIAPPQLQPLAAEYQRLAADLTPHVGDMTKLAEARENAQRQDLTVLNRATGWDARVIALAAKAAVLSANPRVGLSQPVLYGLLRSGLPSDELQLARVSGEAAELALKKAKDAGIVELSDAQITEAKTRFETFARERRLAVPAPGSRSTYGELLAAAGVSDDTRAKFAALYVGHHGDGASLWKKAAEAKIAPADIRALQRQGKLAFLTGNSEPMTTHLRRDMDITEPAQLAERGFYRADQWKAEVRTVAGNDAKRIDALIPPTYTASDVEHRLDAYAEDMARKVRLSYPTQVVAHMVAHDTADAFNLGEARSGTTTLLTNAAATGFRLGRTSVETFVREHPEAVTGIAGDQLAAAKEGVRTLQRVYQLTPSDEAMPILMSLGLKSAYDVAAYTIEEFLKRFGWKFPSIEQATLIHRKAQQVSSVTYNLFTIAKKLDSDARVYGVSAPAEVLDRMKNELIKQFPTMETLFGSLDFPECEHCSSVLSPAAYLVDLLQFIDAEADVWQSFLALWQTNHGGAAYTTKYAKPYDALFARRPDLPHIPLTCENTHTALPYIDVVNEILEYYVAHGELLEDAARDSGDATTAELLAEPQHVIAEAYTTLLADRYPLSLPFDLPIETVRRFCDFFETPFPHLLEVFRPGDALSAPAQSYDRRAVFMESLQLSPAELAIFTDPNPLPRWHELYGFASAAAATTVASDADTGQRIDLNSAKALSRRLGVTYKELVQIVETGFVNPQLAELSTLNKLGVSVHDALHHRAHKAFYDQNKNLLDRERSTLSAADRLRFDALTRQDWERLAELQAFERRLDDATATYAAVGFNARTWLNAAFQNGAFRQVLVLADPDTGGNFDLTTLRYADGRAADAIVFYRINVLVRLWRKLGWTLEEVDGALQAFVPKNTSLETPDHLAKAPLATALLYLAHLQTLDRHLRLGKGGRLQLMTLWSDLPTRGKKSLYAHLFLTHGVLQNDKVFDDPLGRYLSAPARIDAHLLVLQGALGLGADDIGRILTDGGQSIETAQLSLPNVSLLHRHAVLARATKWSVRELIALKRLSGLDPFARLSPDPVDTLANDQPFTQTLRFVEIVDEVRESGLAIDDLEYLLAHRIADPSGKYRSNTAATLTLLTKLAAGIRALRAEHAVPDDPGVMSDDVLRPKLGLALPPDVVERFLAMLNGTAEFTATISEVAAAQALLPQAFAAEPQIRELSYNATSGEQKLTYRGVLLGPRKSALLARLPQPAAGTPHVPSALLASLLDDVQEQARAFFTKHLEKKPADVQPATGFLEPAHFDLLFGMPPAGASEAALQTHVRQQRAALAQAFLPVLQQRLIRQLVVTTLTAQAGADPTLVEGLVTDARLLSETPSGAPTPLLAAFAAVGARGVSASFFSSPDVPGGPLPLPTQTFLDVDTSLKDGSDQPLKPAGTNSARFDGYLEVPAAGAYRFTAALDHPTADAELRFHHLVDPLPLTTVPAASGIERSAHLELAPGVAYRFTLSLRNLGGSEARLLVQSETLPKDSVAQLTLSPSTEVARGERALLLLTKALQLVQGLALSERELRHVLTHASDFGGISLSALPTRESNGAADAERALFAQFLRLAGYARLKHEMAGGTDDLVGVFESQPVEQAYARVAAITRRDERTVKATATALFAAPALANELALRRLWDALRIVERVGVPVAALVGWTRIVGATATPTQRFAIAREAKEALKARFEPEAWRRVARPIFDDLRRRQRDALVAHVMHQHGFARLEQLYEYFLIDPGMEPVVQTSRIRLAIASVQLFIHRCLLNLEPKVHPSVINAKQWEWMKRYRVWEANRKIFLFPENWLEPEFRDDKTHLFTELEGTLLQGDVSNDLVEDACLRYLQKLEELARLDICAMHLDYKADPASNTLHVIGRTFNQPHKYFYRRYVREMWTPWEPVTADVQGDHLAPVVWRDRLYLFWVTFLEKPTQSTTIDNPKVTGSLEVVKLPDIIGDVASMGAKRRIEAHLHWSEYVQGQWTTQESNGIDTPISTTVSVPFDPKSVFIHVSKEPYEAGAERGVFIHLGGAIAQAFYLAGRNSVPATAPRDPEPAIPYGTANAGATRYAFQDALSVVFKRRIVTEDGKPPVVAVETPQILAHTPHFALLPCNSTITLVPPDGADVADSVAAGLADIAALTKPVFYQDQAHTFFVEPNVNEQTIEEWQEWVTQTPQPDPGWSMPDWWQGVFVLPEIPRFDVPFPPGPEDPIWRIDPESILGDVPRRDWLLNPRTGLEFDGELIAPRGRAGTVVLPGMERVGEGTRIDVHAGSGLASGAAILTTPSTVLTNAGLSDTLGLNVVGSGGLNSALATNANVDFNVRLSNLDLAGLGRFDR